MARPANSWTSSDVTDPPARRVLLIGYGNPLRGDDGIGQIVVRRAAAAVASNSALNLTCLVVHQLTPELAEPISRAGRVIFVDATVDAAPGELRQHAIEPATTAGSLTHHLTPPTLLGLAAVLYGRAPEAWVVSIGVGALDAADTLSPAVTAAVPVAVNLVRTLAAAERDGEPVAPAPTGGRHA